MSNAVLVIDMLRGFLEEGNPLYIGEECRSIIPNILTLLTKELDEGSDVIFVCDNHEPDDLEFKMFPPHCIAGTAECLVIPELSDFPGETVLKRRFSGFYDTDLDDLLQSFEPEKLILCGVLTNICVLHTAADARNRDYAVEVPVNCVASPDPDAHRFALEHMEKVLGVTLIGKDNL